METETVRQCTDLLSENGMGTDGNVMMWRMERVTGLCETSRVVAKSRVTVWRGGGVSILVGA